MPIVMRSQHEEGTILSEYVFSRLPDSYVIAPKTAIWANLVSRNCEIPFTEENVEKAVAKAISRYSGKTENPWELFIDAGLVQV